MAVGAIVTGTLFGSAALTLAVGLAPHGLHPLRLLRAAAVLMFATGIGFAFARSFWPLFIVAVVGTLNPSAGDVSVFLPMEQALLSETVKGVDRTRIFAWYNVFATLTGAVGSAAERDARDHRRTSGMEPRLAPNGSDLSAMH